MAQLKTGVLSCLNFLSPAFQTAIPEPFTPWYPGVTTLPHPEAHTSQSRPQSCCAVGHSGELLQRARGGTRCRDADAAMPSAFLLRYPMRITTNLRLGERRCVVSMLPARHHCRHAMRVVCRSGWTLRLRICTSGMVNAGAVFTLRHVRRSTLWYISMSEMGVAAHGSPVGIKVY
jgi:hypothetical protein